MRRAEREAASSTCSSGAPAVLAVLVALCAGGLCWHELESGSELQLRPVSWSATSGTDVARGHASVQRQLRECARAVGHGARTCVGTACGAIGVEACRSLCKTAAVPDRMELHEERAQATERAGAGGRRPPACRFSSAEQERHRRHSGRIRLEVFFGHRLPTRAVETQHSSSFKPHREQHSSSLVLDDLS